MPAYGCLSLSLSLSKYPYTTARMAKTTTTTTTTTATKTPARWPTSVAERESAPRRKNEALPAFLVPRAALVRVLDVSTANTDQDLAVVVVAVVVQHINATNTKQQAKESKTVPVRNGGLRHHIMPEESSCLWLESFWRYTSFETLLTKFLKEHHDHHHHLVVTMTLTLVLLGYLLYSKLAEWNVFYTIRLLLEFLVFPVRQMNVEMTAAELYDDGVVAGDDNKNTATTNKLKKEEDNNNTIACYDPSTGQYLGSVPAMTPQQVNDACCKAAAAQKEWKHTTFRQRRAVLRTLQQYILQHVDDICRVSARDSGKSCLDACLGEVLTTTEKIRCINACGELWLRPSRRPTGPLMVHKRAVVEYVPLGVIAPIAPWNYPWVEIAEVVVVAVCLLLVCVCVCVCVWLEKGTKALLCLFVCLFVCFFLSLNTITTSFSIS